MATPTPTSYSAAHGASIRGGRTAPLPAWLAGKPLNEWFAIPNTSGAGGAPVDDYSGWAVTDAGVIVIAAAGGHGGSTDNRAVAINLLADTLAWQTISATSLTTTDDAAYNPDGKPASRHTYHSTVWVPKLNRVMLIGCYGTHGNATAFTTVDGINPDTGQWDAAGTWPNITVGNDYGVFLDANGDIWDDGGNTKGTITSGVLTWSRPTINPKVQSVRHPWARDTKRNLVFGLSYGDGQGFGAAQMYACYQIGTAQTTVTFDSASATAVAQFMADAPTYAALAYDPNGDCFYFYAGYGAAAGRVYKVTPNGTTQWNLSIAGFSGAVALPSSPATGSGINGKFTYVPALKGIVALPKRSDNLYFLRTA